jgi:hypothetical protein
MSLLLTLEEDRMRNARRLRKGFDLSELSRFELKNDELQALMELENLKVSLGNGTLENLIEIGK